MAVSPHHPALHHPTGNDAATSAAIALLIHYFDLAPASAQLLVKKWLVNYPALWVRAAVTEALYQGRYKPFSVEQILAFWQRRGKAISHFNKEFETIIAVPLKKVLADETAEEVTATNGQPSVNLESLAVGLSSAEQAQAEIESAPVPRPRLMLPGELPGTSLAQQSSTPSPLFQIKSSSPSSNEALPQSTEATTAIQPKGFDGILDPRPRPQVTQGPDSALVAETKAKPGQPLSIGPFTPAADPSGFSSRLKAVVEQAIAKQASNKSNQPQTEAEPSSLGDAIKTQIASDPILGNAGPVDEPLQETIGAPPETTEPAITFEDAPALVSTPEAMAEDDNAIAEPVITPVPLASEDPAKAEELESNALELDQQEIETETAVTDLAVTDSLGSTTDLPSVINEPVESEEPDPWETETASEVGTVTEVEPDAVASSEATNPPPTKELADLPPISTNDLQVPDIQTPEVQPPLEFTTAFEDRFPLNHAQATEANAFHREKDEMDLALDQRLGETSIDNGPEPSQETSTQDRSPEAEETTLSQTTDTLKTPEPGKLLDGDALNRHLATDFEQDATFSQEAGLAPDEDLLITEAEGDLDTSPSQNLVTTSEAVAQTPQAETNKPVGQGETEAEATPNPARLNETALDISQVSNLMASLPPLQQPAKLENFSLADLASLEVPLTSPEQNAIEEDQDEFA